MNNEHNRELVRAGHELAKCLDDDVVALDEIQAQLIEFQSRASV